MPTFGLQQKNVIYCAYINVEQVLFNKRKAIKAATKKVYNMITKDPVNLQSQLRAAVTAMF